jgi:hypothetical protein
MFVFDPVSAYSSDAVFLFSTLDDAETVPTDQSSVLPPNKDAGTIKHPVTTAMTETKVADPLEIVDDGMDHSIWSEAEQIMDEESDLFDEDDGEGEDDDDSGDGGEYPNSDHHSAVPVVFPRSRFTGHCNVETVKDGQFSSHGVQKVALQRFINSCRNLCSSEFSWS